MKDLLKNVKAQITAGVGIVLATLGTVFSDKVEEFFGVEDDAAVAVKQKQEVNVEGPTINITIPEQQKDTVVKKVYVKPKEKLTETEKRKKEGIDWQSIFIINKKENMKDLFKDNNDINEKSVVGFASFVIMVLFAARS